MRIEVPSGLVTIVARGKEYETDIDKLLYATERVERKHSATTERTDWFTLEFKTDLAIEYEKLGIEGCTTTEAAYIRDSVISESRKMREAFFTKPESPPSTT